VSVANTLTIERRNGFTLAMVMARKDVMAEQIGEALGLIAPDKAAMASKSGLTMVGTGPGTWLAIGDGGEASTPAMLASKLARQAFISDLSSSYAIFRLSGTGARCLLQRGAPIDLHPLAFSPGSAATTVIAHMGVILWQIDDLPTYETAVFRSMSKSFEHWLTAGIATV
jgi:heterotetrameric sarcosine oxidase gamma subunit